MGGKWKRGVGHYLDERRHFDEFLTWKQDIITIFETGLWRKKAAARLACRGVGSDIDGIQTHYYTKVKKFLGFLGGLLNDGGNCSSKIRGSTMYSWHI